MGRGLWAPLPGPQEQSCMQVVRGTTHLLLGGGVSPFLRWFPFPVYVGAWTDKGTQAATQRSSPVLFLKIQAASHGPGSCMLLKTLGWEQEGHPFPPVLVWSSATALSDHISAWSFCPAPGTTPSGCAQGRFPTPRRQLLGSQDEYPIEAPLKEGSTCVAPFRFPHGTLIASSHLPFMVGTVLSTILQMGLFPQGHTVSDGDEVWLLACLSPKPLVILNQ